MLQSLQTPASPHSSQGEEATTGPAEAVDGITATTAPPAVPLSLFYTVYYSQPRRSLPCQLSPRRNTAPSPSRRRQTSHQSATGARAGVIQNPPPRGKKDQAADEQEGGMAGAAGRKKRVGRYEVGRTIGQGTFAKVKFAVDADTGAAVAMKVLDKETIFTHRMLHQVPHPPSSAPHFQVKLDSYTARLGLILKFSFSREKSL